MTSYEFCKCYITQSTTNTSGNPALIAKKTYVSNLTMSISWTAEVAVELQSMRWHTFLSKTHLATNEMILQYITNILTGIEAFQ